MSTFTSHPAGSALLGRSEVAPPAHRPVLNAAAMSDPGCDRSVGR